MYGRYNVGTLEKVIQTVNSLHHRQTQLEEVFAKTQSGHVNEVINAISFNFDLHLYMKLVEEEICEPISTIGEGQSRSPEGNCDPWTGEVTP